MPAREIPSILPPAYWVTIEKSLSLSGSQTLPLTIGGIATVVSKLFFFKQSDPGFNHTSLHMGPQAHTQPWKRVPCERCALSSVKYLEI